MKSKIIWLIVSSLLVLSLLMGSCVTKTTPATTTTTTTITTTKPVTTTTMPTTKLTTTTTAAKWWDKFGTPQYGGMIITRLAANPAYWDPYYTNYEAAQMPYLEMLGAYDLTVDPSIWPFSGKYSPVQYRKGGLAESWETPDLQTIVFHIRKGIKWQDKPPVNGREFTADDIAYNYNRLFGLGGGFTKRSPYQSSTTYDAMQSVTAIDKYTVVFKWKQPSLDIVETLTEVIGANAIAAREAVDKWGDVNDWQRAIGTGPYILTDYVSASAITFTQNTNYWGYDVRYPRNQLPYTDALKMLIIPDIATTIAALRSGKIDIVPNVDWIQSASLASTNPKLIQAPWPGPGVTLDFRVDRAPLSDVRLRKALQMSIDTYTIAKEYYGGNADGTPCGMVPPILTEFYTPFDKWPQSLQDEYTYNPTAAKKLLVDAGYPNGFKTDIVASSSTDMNLLEIVKSYFGKIGVDLDIKLMDPASYQAYLRTGVYAMAPMNSARMVFPTNRLIGRRTSTNYTNYTHNNDPVYDAMFNKFNVSLDPNERAKIVIDADMYNLTKHWSLYLPSPNLKCVYQPWLLGYWGQFDMTADVYAMAWINQDIKKSMGH